MLFVVAISVAVQAAPPAKAPAKPAGPNKDSVEYKLDKSFINGFIVESCPASVAVKLLSTKKLAALKVKCDIKVKPNQDRAVTWDLRKRYTLRAALNQLRKYGYTWSCVNNGIVITPIGKPAEWVTGFGSLKIMDGEPKWLNTARVRNVNLNNAAFADVEALLRKQKYKVAGVGKNAIRLTLSAGNVSLKQFLTAVCMASGFDCEVNKQQIRFCKGPTIGYLPMDPNLKKSLVKYKYPDVKKSLNIGEFLQKAPGGTVWVFWHNRGIDMKSFRGTVPAEISGMTLPDAISLVEEVLNVKVHFVSNGVAVIIHNPGAARKAFAKRLQMNLTDLRFQNAPLKKVLDDVVAKSIAADPNRQGLLIVPSMKSFPADKISADIAEIRAEEFLRRLGLAVNCYGYVSKCGTYYSWVADNVFGFKNIVVKKQEPLMLKAIPSGIDRVDIPLDFAEIDFKNASIEDILKFVRKICFSRFGSRMSVRWGISDKNLLKREISFSVKQPTLRAILDALALRSNLGVEFLVNGIFIKQNY